MRFVRKAILYANDDGQLKKIILVKSIRWPIIKWVKKF